MKKILLYVDEYLEEVSGRNAEFSGCRFEKCSFSPCDVGRFYFVDCVFEKCDLSGMNFRECTFQRVKFTGCRRVVILGDNSCVPEKYETMIDKSIPVVRISGDWERVAEELTFMLNLSNLKRSYPKLRKELDRTYQPVSAPAPKAQPKKEEKVEKVNKVEPVLASEEK